MHEKVNRKLNWHIEKLQHETWQGSMGKKDNVMQQEPQVFAIMYTVVIMRREKQHIQTG